MNPILEWLTGGDLRSDGMSDEVADIVLKNPSLFDEIITGLQEEDDVIRARTADTLEKICRSKPEYLKEHVSQLIQLAREDHVAMVRMHLAMIFGYLAIYEELLQDLQEVLFFMLDDRKVFAKSWAIVSLCIIGRKYPERRDQIVRRIVPLQKDDSIAIRTRVRYAMEILTQGKEFPKGWIKSECL